MVTNTEYVERFSYRKYSGEVEPRWKRILSLARFEMISTWHKSTWGKVLLIILVIINVFIAFISLSVLSFALQNVSGQEKQEMITTQLSTLVGEYFSIGSSVTTRTSFEDGAYFNIQLGFLIISLIAIAGSGFFADDRQGQIIEVYLARLTREEYAIGKLFGMFLYSNLFTTLPLLFTTALFIQGYGENHLDYIGHYVNVTMYGFLVALLLGLGILLLSTLVEKRMYASLGFFLFYLLGSMFGSSLGSNEFLLLLSPSNFLSLLGYVIIGEYELNIPAYDESGNPTGFSSLLLNNGVDLEAIHVIGLFIGLIVVLFSFLLYKIHRLTTEDI
ncbi:MAG: hypothetical protein ACXAC7_02690 [Candidatus Hodarchaeales archaeon]|jgi:hypothetical protein